MLTSERKREVIKTITEALDELIQVDEHETSSSTSDSEDENMEMLSIKECSELVKGLSKHSIRQLILRGKIPYFRTGQGRNGKILISKSALLNYLESC